MITRNAFIDRVGTIESDGTHCQSVFYAHPEKHNFLNFFARMIELMLKMFSGLIQMLLHKINQPISIT
jgi:hypothetical protein